MTLNGSSLLVVVALFFESRATISFGASADLGEIRRVPESLSEAFCRGDFSFQTMWSFGLYDAQVEGAILKSANGKPLSSDTGIGRAKDLAKETGKFGYAGGNCKDGSAWAAVFPSPFPMTVERFELDLSRYRPFCKSAPKVYFSLAQSGGAEEIAGKRDHYKFPAQDGFVSVVCNDKTRGPLEVFLGRTGQTKPQRPGKQSLFGTNDTERTLNWINEVRVQNGRQPLILDSELIRTSEALALGSTIEHDVKRLGAESSRLKLKHILLFGENRVKAKTLDEALTLLWISPMHRDLILHEKATHIGMALRGDADRFLQLTVGRR